jgi:hypothetical protein
LAATVATEGAATPIFYGTGAASLPFQYTGMKDENRMELFEKKAKNIKQILSDPSVASDEEVSTIMNDLFDKAIARSKEEGLSEEYIKKRYTGGSELKVDNLNDTGMLNLFKDFSSGFIKSNDPIMRNADLLSSKGLQALFEMNNMRTGGDLALQTVLMYGPAGKIVDKGGKFIFRGAERLEGRLIERSLKNRVSADASGRVTATVAEAEAAKEATRQSTKYANGFRKKSMAETFNTGFETGASAAAASGHGVVGTTAAGLVGGSVNVAARLAKSALPRK